MLKQSDALIIFVVLAAVVGILIFSSNTASLVVVAGLAMGFGGLIGTRLRKSQSAEQDNETAETGRPLRRAGARPRPRPS